LLGRDIIFFYKFNEKANGCGGNPAIKQSTPVPILFVIASNLFGALTTPS
jgi:hypothetical protein